MKTQVVDGPPPQAPGLPPGPKSRLPGAIFLRIRRDPLTFFQQTARSYGDVATFALAGQRAYLLSHPDDIQDVLETPYGAFRKGRVLDNAKRLLGEGLLTSEGEFHKHQRRLVQPAFHKQRMLGYGAVMADYAAQTRDAWQPGQALDMHQEMMRLTRAIVAKTLFDYDVSSASDTVDAALKTLIELFGLISLPFAGLIERLPLPANRRMRAAEATLDGLIYTMIRERRASGADHGDLLSTLLLAVDHGAPSGMSTVPEGGSDAEVQSPPAEVGSPAAEVKSATAEVGLPAAEVKATAGVTDHTPAEGAPMTDRQVRDEVLTLFLAGHETTANALTWTWVLLGEHPHVAESLRAELDAVLAGRTPAVQDLDNLVYTRMVFSEAMRLYPPAWAIGRRALRDHAVRGHVIPAGAAVLVSPYVVHHDERWYPEPERFDPERWRPEAVAARPKYAYFPFGGGPRRCIGEAFAWMEGVLILATLAARWQPRLAPGEHIRQQPRITLRPAGPHGGVPMTLAD